MELISVATGRSVGSSINMQVATLRAMSSHFVRRFAFYGEPDTCADITYQVVQAQYLPLYPLLFGLPCSPWSSCKSAAGEPRESTTKITDSFPSKAGGQPGGLYTRWAFPDELLRYLILVIGVQGLYRVVVYMAHADTTQLTYLRCGKQRAAAA